MKLTALKVEKFRTISTSQSLDVDPNITILMGANESGKTNLLEAINKFYISNPYTSEDITKSSDEYAENTYPTISFHFKVNEEEINELSTIIPNIEQSNNFIIIKNNNDSDGYKLIITKQENIEKIRKQIEVTESLVEEAGKEYRLKNEEVIEIEQKRTSDISSEDRANLTKILRNKRRARTKVVTYGTKLNIELTALNSLLESVEDLVFDLSSTQLNSLFEFLPSFEYYSELNLLPNQIDLPQLIAQDTPESKAYGNLLINNGINKLSSLQENQTRARTLLRRASTRLTRKFNELWEQEEIKLNLLMEANILRIEIEEDISVQSLLSERSEGFQWFFSFFAIFLSSNDILSKILLLDEPALKLHPKGKKEFVRIIEQISQNHQIIYTSHSPFLINRNYPHRIRVLKKDRTLGSTIIDNKPYADGTRRCWEPLKTSIGVCLGDFLSFGMSNLIVEGVSDQILLSGFSHKLALIGEEHLDLEKISIYPSEGSNNVVYRAKFAYEEELNPIILLDSDEAGKKAAKKAKEKLKEVPMITISQIDKKAKTTEDLIPINLYLNATNTFYNELKLDKYVEITEDSIDKETLGKSGVVVSIHKHFEEFDYSFDKTAVAKEIVKSVNIKKDDMSEYAKIISLFQTINSTLN